ncbi:hypothetical protein KIW84_033702 [Lathyrus oleraceus]|uniref:Uncharacterized protein n=1 Tax=Pisum sativum TaxID=3888 RepID=A0A9D4XZ86_PEA|nr:hypothetical protein KIW84_033702 [Pisum sativum]
MRFSGVLVKAFDGSRKTVIGEVDLPIKIVTSTLHTKLKFVNNGKLVIVGGEHAMLVSHLSSFSYIDADEADGTLFQDLSIDNIVIKKSGQIFKLAKNKNIVGLGFSPGGTQRDLKRIQEVFHSAGFIHSKDQFVVAILENDEEQEAPDFVTRGSMCQKWITVDVPSVICFSK